MKVSIITVSYNSSKTISNTIKSVLQQDYDNIEYIIVDGCSTDGTLEIINEYKNKFISLYFISEPDSGLYDAMNKGISLATGDLIGILNSDDIFFNNNVISDVVEFHKNNCIDASVGDIIQYNPKSNFKRKYSSIKWNPNDLKRGLMPPHPSLFIDKKLFLKYGNYNKKIKIGADFEIITRFFLKNNIKWKYSGVTTTKMLTGGMSSSGLISYLRISRDIEYSLNINKVQFNKLNIIFRFLYKINEFKLSFIKK